MAEGPLVLVVDDDPGIRELVRSVLVDDGYRVSTATTGEGGVAFLRRERPNLIVLDVQMPGLDGWGFRAAQLAMARTRDVPVVLVTAAGRWDPPSAELAPAAVLPKPFDLDELLATVARLVGRAAPEARDAAGHRRAVLGLGHQARTGAAPA